MAAERVANLCPVGKFCPAGSTDGTNCAKGSFAPTKGMLECVKCPAGYLCEDPSLNLSQQPCPEGYFCPAGGHSPATTTCDASKMCCSAFHFLALTRCVVLGCLQLQVTNRPARLEL